MNKGQKYSLTIAIVLLTIIVVVILISNWWQVVLEGKPNGPYHSSISIKEAKKDKVWIGTYFSDSEKYFSSDKTDSIELSEIWIEKNINNKEIYWAEADYKNILSIYFNRLTENDLHKFRLIPFKPLKLNEYVEHPDRSPRVRFLLNEIPDTIRIEIIERNPDDSLAWTTEKIIDTITLIKKY
jgi:hypothetical protein